MNKAGHTKTASCRSCRAIIVWMKTEAGKYMPVDVDSVSEGDEIFSQADGHVSHFATCPNASQHRKRDKT